MKTGSDYLGIGELARRAGVASSALRFYEEKGLIQSQRSPGNQRHYHRAELRKVSIIKIAQSLGFTLQEISDALSSLPDRRAPNARDWQRISRHWRRQLDDRIANLEQLRDQLTACIGCGCLSLRKCALYNPGDRAALQGTGPRYLIEAVEPDTKHST